MRTNPEARDAARSHLPEFLKKHLRSEKQE